MVGRVLCSICRYVTGDLEIEDKNGEKHKICFGCGRVIYLAYKECMKEILPEG